VKQGDVSLLDHPLAQELLASNIPARLAYSWKDGTPRVIPIFFLWSNGELQVYSAPNAPKMRALQNGSRVAITIDSNEWPCKVLMLRGPVDLRRARGTQEIVDIAERYVGTEAANANAEQFANWWPDGCIISVRPDWVAIIDYVERFPSVVHAAMAGDSQ
jgi:hypothetical protein